MKPQGISDVYCDMKTLLLFALLTVPMIAEPPQTGVVQAGLTYKVTPYSGGLFPAYSFVSIQTSNTQTAAVRVTVNFVDGSSAGQVVEVRMHSEPMQTCTELQGRPGACAFILGDWPKVVSLKIEELQVAATHEVQ